ncbi:MAG: hypothetical protein SPI77_00185 [Corynebacterium sp.]|nr:hypothetical protein [Corynebacterium sp.]
MARRLNRNWLAVAVIAAVSAAGVGVTALTAPSTHAHLTRTEATVRSEGVLSAAPGGVREAYSLRDDAVPGAYAPLAANGVVVTASGEEATGTDASTGQALWTYRRNVPICSTGIIDGAVALTYATGIGCGEVTSIDLTEGTYKDGRAALADAPEAVTPIQSNSSVGLVSTRRVELWRNDLVRTVEYGDVDVKQEPQFQPHEECTIDSALARVEVLAVVETCADGTWLRIQDAVPDDSRKPEITHDVLVPEGAHVVGVSKDSTAVATASDYFTYSNESGQPMTTTKLGEASVPDFTPPAPGLPFVPAVADLPHNISWYSNGTLYILHPTTLAMERTVGPTVGTGVVVGNTLLAPTREGIARFDATTWEDQGTLPVDRHGYTGPVHLRAAGEALVEKRGDAVVGLLAQ